MADGFNKRTTTAETVDITNHAEHVLVTNPVDLEAGVGGGTQIWFNPVDFGVSFASATKLNIGVGYNFMPFSAALVTTQFTRVVRYDATGTATIYTPESYPFLYAGGVLTVTGATFAAGDVGWRVEIIGSPKGVQRTGQLVPQQMNVIAGSDGTNTQVASITTTGLQVRQGTAANLNMTEANSAAILLDTADIEIATEKIAAEVSPTNGLAVIQSDATKLKATITGTAVVSGTVAVSGVAGTVEVVQDNASDLKCTEASAASILTAVQVIDDPIVNRDVASPDAGTQIHGRGSSATPAAVSLDGDAVDPWFDLVGRLHVVVDSGTTPILSTWVCTAGELVGDTVYNLAGVARQANGGATGTMPVIGMILSKPTAISAIVVQAGLLSGVLGGLTPGAYYYADKVNGLITTTVPTAVGGWAVRQVIGHAQTATDFIIDRQPAITL